MLFGTTLAALTADHITLLVENGVGEEFDLDFKSSPYGRSDSDRRALASDVAALANTAGGVIIVGVKEDTQARASAAPGVALSDDEASRMRQIVASEHVGRRAKPQVAMRGRSQGENWHKEEEQHLGSQESGCSLSLPLGFASRSPLGDRSVDQHRDPVSMAVRRALPRNGGLCAQRQVE